MWRREAFSCPKQHTEGELENMLTPVGSKKKKEKLLILLFPQFL